MINKRTLGIFSFFILLWPIISETTVTNDFADSISIAPLSNNYFSLNQNYQALKFAPGEKKYTLLELPGVDRGEVARFRQMFLTPRYFKLLKEALEGATEYRLFIRKELEKAKLPMEIEYLPVVESYYKVNAKSHAGALGMWQFMANSVKPFMQLTDYIDERLDPWVETTAAIKKLKENYDRFKDWNLAIGAYNCGAGGMGRAVNSAEIKDYWFLVTKNLIPEETRLYVPKLIAISDLVINQEYYGISLPTLENEYNEYCKKNIPEFDYIKVNGSYTIDDLAKRFKIDAKLMEKLNPSFIKGCTPPNSKSIIRLPYGTIKKYRDVVAKIAPDSLPTKHTVIAGDTLFSLSQKNGVTVREICNFNDIKEDSVLSVGKILYIPQKNPR